jgi:hypothetical protein
MGFRRRSTRKPSALAGAGMKGASANLAVIPNQVLNQVQDLTIRDLDFGLENLGFNAPPCGGVLYFCTFHRLS